MEGGEVGVDFRKYVEALEEERRKIQVFRRELPLCLELITQAIDSCRQQLSGTTTEYFNRGQSESSEHNSGEVPVLEEFIPIKRSDLVDVDEESDEENKMNDKKEEAQADWLRSAQLWNQSADSPVKEDIAKKKCIVIYGGGFQPFQRDKTEVIKANHQSPTPAAAASTLAETVSGSGGGSGEPEEKEGGGQTKRKQRRCWSPELHKRFLHALQQLGGSHAATPKQIRELMKVDGLTNDEVKSHLQKYRLHTRRPGSAIQNNGSLQRQFVVVGGIWVPRAPAAAETITGGTGNRVYAPVAARPDSGSEESGSVIVEREVGKGKVLKERRVSGSEAGVESSSTATSVSHL